MCLTSAHGNLFLVSVTSAGTVQIQMVLPPAEEMFPSGQYGKIPEVPGDKTTGG